MENSVNYTLSDYLVAARRRYRPALATLMIFVCGAIFIANTLPEYFQSSSSILIEQQKIPDDLVRATVNTYVDEQLQILNQLVLTRKSLQRINQKYQVYPDIESEQLLVEAFSEDLIVEPLSAAVVNPQSGREFDATIAFTITYENPSPDLAQKVVAELTDLYLTENVRSRRSLAAETKEFLEAEQQQLLVRLTETDKRLVEFRHENSTNLPEFMVLNIQTIERSARGLAEAKRQLLILTNRRINLESELQQLSLDGNAGDELSQLKRKFAVQSALLGPDHPDIKKLRSEIIALGGNVDSLITVGDSAEAERVRIQLKAARAKYADSHPEVISLSRQLSVLEQGARNPTTSNAELSGMSPASIRVTTELRSVIAEAKSINARIVDLTKEYEEVERRLALMPAVEEQYASLQRAYATATADYDDITAKLFEAKRGETLELENQAQRFTILEPAYLPTSPSAPNKPAIILVGLIFGLAFAIGIVLVLEASDNTIRSAKDIESITSMPPIAEVPRITNLQDLRLQRAQGISYAFALTVLIVLTLAAVVL